MKEFKGTPGSWIKRDDGIVAPGDIEVAVVVNFQDEVAMNADANLIAAAPDLLLFLQQIVSSAYRLGIVSDDDSGLSLEVSKAEFYIAKALGETK